MQILQNLSMIIGPIAHYHTNSTYYSAIIPPPLPPSSSTHAHPGSSTGSSSGGGGRRETTTHNNPNAGIQREFGKGFKAEYREFEKMYADVCEAGRVVCFVRL
jgi:hypothetical protein